MITKKSCTMPNENNKKTSIHKNKIKVNMDNISFFTVFE